MMHIKLQFVVWHTWTELGMTLTSLYQRGVVRGAGSGLASVAKPLCAICSTCLTRPPFMHASRLLLLQNVSPGSVQLGGVSCNLVGYNCLHSMHLSNFLEGVTKARQSFLISQEWLLSINRSSVTYRYSGWTGQQKVNLSFKLIVMCKGDGCAIHTPMVFSVQQILFNRDCRPDFYSH